MSIPPLLHTLEPVILASGSPRRRKLLAGLGLTFKVMPAVIDETPGNREQPEDFARRMAVAKAAAVAGTAPSSWVVGADTIVVMPGETILGKPGNREHALMMLRQLRGNTHRVMTGLCLCCLDKGIKTSLVETTAVTFTEAGDEVLQAYIRTGEPLDKAGAYGIQGIGSFLVREIHGSCSNVIGLPLHRLLSLLIENRVAAPA